MKKIRIVIAVLSLGFSSFVSADTVLEKALKLSESSDRYERITGFRRLGQIYFKDKINQGYIDEKKAGEYFVKYYKELADEYGLTIAQGWAYQHARRLGGTVELTDMLMDFAGETGQYRLERHTRARAVPQSREYQRRKFFKNPFWRLELEHNRQNKCRADF